MNELKHFRFFAQSVLPLVYDESLSYYEVLCKVVNYINDLISNDEILANKYGELSTQMTELKNYVDNFFESSDFEQLVKDAIEELMSTGELAELIREILQDLTGIVSNVKTFGAVGDGVTDDTSAIEDAIDNANLYGIPLWFEPFKTYKANISGGISPSIYGNCATIDGIVLDVELGNCFIRDLKIIQRANNGGAGAFVAKHWLENVVIENVEYVASDSTQGQPCFRLCGSNVKVENCRCYTTSRFIIYSDAYNDATEATVYIDKIYGYNISTLIDFECTKKLVSPVITNVKHINESGLIPYTVGYDSVLISGCNSASIDGVYAENVGERIIYCNTTNNAVIRNIYGIGSEGVKYCGLANDIVGSSSIENVTLFGCKQYGVIMYDVTGVECNNLTIDMGNNSNNTAAIYLERTCNGVNFNHVSITNSYRYAVFMNNTLNVPSAIQNIQFNDLRLEKNGLGVAYAPITIRGNVSNGVVYCNFAGIKINENLNTPAQNTLNNYGIDAEYATSCNYEGIINKVSSLIRAVGSLNSSYYLKTVYSLVLGVTDIINAVDYGEITFLNPDRASFRTAVLSLGGGGLPSLVLSGSNIISGNILPIEDVNYGDFKVYSKTGVLEYHYDGTSLTAGNQILSGWGMTVTDGYFKNGGAETYIEAHLVYHKKQ